MGKMRKQFNRLCHVRTIKASSYLIVISAEMFIDNSVLKPLSADTDGVQIPCFSTWMK